MTEQELARNASHHRAVIRHAQEVTGNVAKTCRYFGIRRTIYYRWYRRYEAEGLDGLRDRSKRPLVSPKQGYTPIDVVDGSAVALSDTSAPGLRDNLLAIQSDMRWRRLRYAQRTATPDSVVCPSHPTNYLDIRVIGVDGSPLRHLTLDPTRNYQPLGRL